MARAARERSKQEREARSRACEAVARAARESKQACEAVARAARERSKQEREARSRACEAVARAARERSKQEREARSRACEAVARAARERSKQEREARSRACEAVARAARERSKQEREARSRACEAVARAARERSKQEREARSRACEAVARAARERSKQEREARSRANRPPFMRVWPGVLVPRPCPRRSRPGALPSDLLQHVDPLDRGGSRLGSGCSLLRCDQPQVSYCARSFRTWPVRGLLQGRCERRRKADEAGRLDVDLGGGVEATGPRPETRGERPRAGDSGDAGQHRGAGDPPPHLAELAGYYGLKLQPVEAGQRPAGHHQMCRSPPQPDGRCIDGRSLNHMYGRPVESVGRAQPLDEVLQPRMVTRRERPSPKGPEGRLRRPRPEQGCD